MTTRKSAKAIIKGLKEELETYGVVFTREDGCNVAKPLNDVAEDAMGLRQRVDLEQAVQRVERFFLDAEEGYRHEAEAPIRVAKRIAEREAKAETRALAKKRKPKTLSL
jgi:hypothetical protein